MLPTRCSRYHFTHHMQLMAGGVALNMKEPNILRNCRARREPETAGPHTKLGPTDIAGTGRNQAGSRG